MPATTLSAHLNRWSKRLQSYSDSARLDAEILLKHISGLSDAQLITLDDQPLDNETIQRVNALVTSREQGFPIAYLTGWREFYGLKLAISADVLIPRPETELLVDIALQRIQTIAKPQILDLGTGSGAIALAVAGNTKTARLTATDFDKKALLIAAQNAKLNGIQNITFLQSDWYAKLKGNQFDLIVSNPPYIDPKDPHLTQGDVRFEPRHALVSPNKGRADIRKIIERAASHLKPGGWIALEHGYDQGAFTRERLEHHGFSKVATSKDLNLHDRVTLGRWSPR